MQLCQTIFKAVNRCRPPNSRARFPIYMISPSAFWSPPGAGGGICLVWTGNLNSSANTMTDGKIPVGTCDQQTGCDLFSLRGRQQTYCVCGTAVTNIWFENFLRAGSISSGGGGERCYLCDFSSKNGEFSIRPRGEEKKLKMNESRCHIHALNSVWFTASVCWGNGEHGEVLSSKDVGFVMPERFFVFGVLNNVLS